MPNWDLFLSDQLELQRNLTTAEVRAARARGEVRDDDLFRPAGSNDPWGRLADLPGLWEEPAEPSTGLVGTGSGEVLLDPASTPTSAFEPPPGAPTVLIQEDEPGEETLDARTDEDDGPDSFDERQLAGSFAPIRTDAPAETRDHGAPSYFLLDDEDEPPGRETEEGLRTEFDPSLDDLPGAAPAAVGPAETQELGRFDLDLEGPTSRSRVALPVAHEPIRWNAPAASVAELDATDPLAEDDEAAEFTLARGGPEKVEELDLAAMVDVAFQLVLFFLVTATTVLYKTLEVPKPNPEQAQAASQEGAREARSLEDLQADYILVEIDPQGTFTVDREPVAADFNALAERLRKARKDTGRTAMLLTADAATLHRHAVLAYDVANEIGLRIAIARPSADRPAPAPPAAPAKAAPG